MGAFFHGWQTKIGLVALIVSFSISVAILLQRARWASDGEILLPVRVFVFDAVHLRPISNVECLVFRSPPAIDPHTLADHYPGNSAVGKWPDECRGITDANGFCVIEHNFGTSANHEHPNPHAHLMNAWVRVEAIDFGGVVVPVGYDERLTSTLRKDGLILISIGLMPKK